MKARIQMVSAMTLFGTIAIFVKNLTFSSAATALLRAVIGVCFLLLVRWIRKPDQRIAVPRRERILLFISGALIGFNWIFLFEAYRYTTVAVAGMCYYFAPMLAMLAGIFFLKDKVTWQQMTCFALATVGLFLIADVGQLKTGTNAMGIAFSLAAAVLYATVIVFNRCIATVAGTERTLLQLTAAGVVLLPYMLLTGGISSQQITLRNIILILILGIFQTGVAYRLYFTSLKNLQGHEIALFSYFDPLITVLSSLLVFREPMTQWQAIGCGMIFVFTMLSQCKPSAFRRKTCQ